MSPSEAYQKGREEGRRDGLDAAAEYVAGAAENYPTDIFTRPKRGQHGRTVDSCSAAALRAVLPRLAREIRSMALEPMG